MRAKPARPVLDRTHSLARSLVSFWAFHEKTGSLRDVSGRKKTASEGDVADPPTKAVDATGRVRRFNGSTEFFAIDQGPAIHRNVGGYSFAMVASSALIDDGQEFAYSEGNTGENNTVFGVGQDDSTSIRILIRGSDATIWYATLTAHSGIWDDGMPHVIVLVIPGDHSELLVYADGAREEVSFGGGSSTLDTNRATIGVLGRVGEALHFRGDISMIAGWHRELSYSEVRSLTKDPFEAVRPRHTPVGFAPTGAALVQIINETVQVVEATVSARAMVRLINETVQLVEATTSTRAIVQLINETVQLVEGTEQHRAMVRLINETVQAAETTVSARAMVRLINETIQVVEGTEQHRAIVQLVTEIVQVTETTLRPRVLVRLIAEVLQVAETTVSARAMVRLVDEVVQITEGTEQHRAIVQLINETVNIPETSVEALSILIVQVINETVNIPETVSQNKDITQIVSETLQLIETTRRPRTMTRVLDESVSVIEAAIAARAMIRVVNETLQVVEATGNKIQLAGAGGPLVNVDVNLTDTNIDVNLPSLGVEVTI